MSCNSFRNEDFQKMSVWHGYWLQCKYKHGTISVSPRFLSRYSYNSSVCLSKHELRECYVAISVSFARRLDWCIVRHVSLVRAQQTLRFTLVLTCTRIWITRPSFWTPANTICTTVSWSRVVTCPGSGLSSYSTLLGARCPTSKVAPTPVNWAQNQCKFHW